MAHKIFSFRNIPNVYSKKIHPADELTDGKETQRRLPG
jgi:hypothetical protein